MLLLQVCVILEEQVLGNDHLMLISVKSNSFGQGARTVYLLRNMVESR